MAAIPLVITTLDLVATPLVVSTTMKGNTFQFSFSWTRVDLHGESALEGQLGRAGHEDLSGPRLVPLNRQRPTWQLRTQQQHASAQQCSPCVLLCIEIHERFCLHHETPLS